MEGEKTFSISGEVEKEEKSKKGKEVTPRPSIEKLRRDNTIHSSHPFKRGESKIQGDESKGAEITDPLQQLSDRHKEVNLDSVTETNQQIQEHVRAFARLPLMAEKDIIDINTLIHRAREQTELAHKDKDDEGREISPEHRQAAVEKLKKIGSEIKNWKKHLVDGDRHKEVNLDSVTETNQQIREYVRALARLPLMAEKDIININTLIHRAWEQTELARKGKDDEGREISPEDRQAAVEKLKKIGSEIKNWKKHLVDGEGPSPSSAEYLLAGTTQKPPEGSIHSSGKEDSVEAERQSLSSTDSAAERRDYINKWFGQMEEQFNKMSEEIKQMRQEEFNQIKKEYQACMTKVKNNEKTAQDEGEVGMHAASLKLDKMLRNIPLDKQVEASNKNFADLRKQFNELIGYMPTKREETYRTEFNRIYDKYQMWYTKATSNERTAKDMEKSVIDKITDELTKMIGDMRRDKQVAELEDDQIKESLIEIENALDEDRRSASAATTTTTAKRINVIKNNFDTLLKRPQSEHEKALRDLQKITYLNSASYKKKLDKERPQWFQEWYRL